MGLGLFDMDGLSIFGHLKILNNGTVTTLLGIAGDYLRIGDAGTTAHSLDSEDDLMVTGELEVKGAGFIDGILTLGADILIGANKLQTTNLRFYQISSTGWIMDENVGGVNVDLTLRNVLAVGYTQYLEITAPGAGGANTARIYAVEGGGGLTDLAAVFQDGTVDIFAQEV